jgi:hypothetical protein
MKVDITEFRSRHGNGPSGTAPNGGWRFTIQRALSMESFKAPDSDDYGKALAGVKEYIRRNYAGQNVTIRLDA